MTADARRALSPLKSVPAVIFGRFVPGNVQHIAVEMDDVAALVTAHDGEVPEPAHLAVRAHDAIFLFVAFGPSLRELCDFGRDA